MTKAIVVDEIGGPEKLVWKERSVAAPGPGQLRIRQKAAGLNFIDVYFRNGTYKAPRLSLIHI